MHLRLSPDFIKEFGNISLCIPKLGIRRQ